jgi:hypothetical protein
MLQIPNEQLFNKSKPYADLAQLYLSETTLQSVISVEKQQAVLQQLDTRIKNEQFYFITDVRTGEITHCNGISRWLDYTDTRFIQKNYLHCIHPAHVVIQGFYAHALFEVFINKKINTRFLQPNSITTLALKNKKGNYIYCKRQCYPFQLTGDNRMTEYISEFTIVKEFAGEDYHTRIYNEKDLSIHYNETLKKAVQKKFEETPGFSVQELRILKRYASTENITSEIIAKAFKIEKVTVDKFNKRILRKCENIFGQSFSNAKKAAEYFRRVQLI